MIKNQEALKRGSYYLNRMNLKAKDYMIKLGDYAVFEEDGKFVAETSMEEMDFDSFKDIERYFTILYEDYLAQKFANEIPELSQSFIYDGLGEGNRNAEIKSNGKRIVFLYNDLFGDNWTERTVFEDIKNEKLIIYRLDGRHYAIYWKKYHESFIAISLFDGKIIRSYPNIPRTNEAKERAELAIGNLNKMARAYYSGTDNITVYEKDYNYLVVSDDAEKETFTSIDNLEDYFTDLYKEYAKEVLADELDILYKEPKGKELNRIKDRYLVFEKIDCIMMLYALQGEDKTWEWDLHWNVTVDDILRDYNNGDLAINITDEYNVFTYGDYKIKSVVKEAQDRKYLDNGFSKISEKEG